MDAGPRDCPVRGIAQAVTLPPVRGHARRTMLGQQCCARMMPHSDDARAQRGRHDDDQSMKATMLASLAVQPPCLHWPELWNRLFNVNHPDVCVLPWGPVRRLAVA